MEPTNIIPPVVESAPLISPQKSSKKWIIILSIIVAVIVVGGVGAYAFNDIFSSPEVIVKKGFLKLVQADTYHAESSIKFNLPMGKSQAPVQVKVAGDVDYSDSNSKKYQSIVEAKTSGMSFSAEGKIIGNILYVNVVEFPLLAFTPYNEYINKWYSITQKDFENAAKTSGQGNFSEIKDILGTSTKADRIERFSKIFDQKIIKNFKEIESGEIAGQKVKRYSAEIDSEKLEQVVVEYLKKNMKDEDISARVSNEAIEVGLSEAMKAITVKDIVFSVGKSDGALRGVSMNVSVNDPRINPALDVSYATEFSNINKPVSITVPEDVTPLSELIEKTLGEARQKSADAASKSVLSSHRAAAELFYDKNLSYGGYCSSSDFKKYSYPGVNISCVASPSKYVFYTLLSTGEYQCADSTGLMLTLKKVPTGFACK